MAFRAFGRKLMRVSALGFIFACLVLGAATAPFAATPITVVNLLQASACLKGQEPTLTAPCHPGANTVIDLSVFPSCAPLANPTPIIPCQPTVITGRMNIGQFRPCAAGEEPTWDKPCAPAANTVLDLRWFPRCQKGEDPTASNPCRPTRANGQINITSFARCTAGQQPTPDKPCAPTATTKVDFGLFPACASGEKPSATRPCRPAGIRSTNPFLPTPPIDAKTVKTSSPSKYVTLPVCSAGQRSTKTKPCIALNDKGPSTSGSASTKTPAAAPVGDPVYEPARIAARLNDHLCERAGDGEVIECPPNAAIGDVITEGSTDSSGSSVRDHSCHEPA
jgi:hypothetical protein